MTLARYFKTSMQIGQTGFGSLTDARDTSTIMKSLIGDESPLKSEAFGMWNFVIGKRFHRGYSPLYKFERL